MSEFKEQKKRALEKLRMRGADEEVEEIIEKLNRLDGFFTTSSCSGRISLICIPEIGAKREAEFIGKWHRPVRKEEVFEAMNDVKSSGKGEIWLLSQPPIVHVACRGLEKAKELLRIAIESGFKYSSIKAISRNNERVVVEIMSTERMDVPLGKDNMMFCSEAHLDFILSKAKFMLERGKEKLKRFCYGLKELE